MHWLLQMLLELTLAKEERKQQTCGYSRSKLDLQKQINSQLQRDWLSTPALALPSLDGPAPPTQKVN